MNTLTINPLTKFKQEVHLESQRKHDEITDISLFRMNARGNMDTKDGQFQDVPMTEWASNQLCQKFGIPFRYFEMCPPNLQQTNVNYWLEQSSSKNVMIRLRKEKENAQERDIIRAIVTDKYAKFDNHEILGLVDDYLQQVNEPFKVEFAKQNGDNMHLRLTFDRLTTSIGQTPDGQPDIHKVGIHIMNSEVGKSAVRIMPMVYRLVCTNGLMAWTVDDNIFTQRHAYIKEEDMLERVAVAIGDALKMSDHTIDILQKAKRHKVDNPFAVIDKLAKDKKYSKKLVEEVKKQYVEENDGKDSSLFYVIQAFTRSARELKEEERIEVERDAASLLELLRDAA